jgi:ubiquinone/menaquinone biosynthesis C-methylase UbiE
MKMSRLEKRFVNRRKKSQGNFEKIKECFNLFEYQNIKDVLEIGCGIGVVSSLLVENYQMTVTGTDIDPEEIEMAKVMNPENEKLSFKVEDATNLSFSENSFDLVISQNVFHHIPNWDKTIQEIKRILHPNGYVIWFDLAFPKIFKKIFKPFKNKFGLYTFEDVHNCYLENSFQKINYKSYLHGLFKHHQLLFQLK